MRKQAERDGKKMEKKIRGLGLSPLPETKIPGYVTGGGSTCFQ